MRGRRTRHVGIDKLEARIAVGHCGLELVMKKSVLDNIDELMLLDRWRKWQTLRIPILVRPGPVPIKGLGRILVAVFLQVAKNKVVDVVAAERAVAHRNVDYLTPS